MLAIIALVLGLLFVSPAPETCDGIHALVGGELVAWLGYDNSGWQLPSDLKKIGRVDFASGGAWAYHSESEQARYVWVFTSYEQTADAQGNHFGAHSFCGPYRIADDG